jgi:hypothetical protein
MNNHLMLDLETFGTSRDAAIVSIGAVWFDPFGEGVGQQLDAKIDFASRNIGRPDVATVVWWLQQNQEVQTALLSGFRVHLDKALHSFCERVELEGQVEGFWSNGPMFDEALLRSAFERCEIAWPKLISFRASRDFRTIVQVGQMFGIQRTPSDQIKHDALADAIDQASYVQKVFRRLHALR